MAYGLQIYSANGALQLDSNDATHVIYQMGLSGTSGTVSGANSSTPVFAGVNVTVSNYNPQEDLLFYQPTGSAAVAAYVIPISTGFTIFSNTNTSFYYYIFRKVTTLGDPSSNYGIEIYDASGNILFNQDVLAARVKGRITGTGNVVASGKSLYALGSFKYQLITSQLYPRRGKVRAWCANWNAARDQVSFGTRVTDVDGVSAATEAELNDSFYVDTTEPTILVIEAPDP